MHPLLDIAGLAPEQKASRISAHYPALHNHPSGIFYSLLKIDGDRIRPFEPADFAGIETFSFNGWRYRPEGPWEYRNNENSIFTSGLWLVAQVERFLATGEEEAAVFQLGEEDADIVSDVGGPAIGDLDGDGTPEVIVQSITGSLAALAPDGEVLWYSAAQSSVIFGYAPVGIADMDSDGLAEVFAGSVAVKTISGMPSPSRSPTAGGPTMLV